MDNNQGTELLLPGMTGQNSSNPADTPAAQGKGDSSQRNQDNQVLSPSQMQAEIARQVKEAVQAAFGDVQGMVDSKLSTQNKQVQAALAAAEQQIKDYEGLGKELSEQDKTKLRNQARDRVMLQQADPSDDSSGDSGKGSRQPLGENLTEAELQAEYARIRSMFPFGINDTDPEAKNLLPLIQAGNKAEFVKLFPLALQAKALRLQSEGGGNPGARSVGGLGSGGVGTPNPIQNITNPNDLIAEGVKQMQQKGKLD